MKINKIQITAFGKLKNFELVVSDNLNLVYGDNEAGKSTVMAFVKMALYGSTVRGNGLDNPRIKYLPFDGTAMGGVLYFSQDRINYRLECKFGGTPAKDKISLFNDDTGEALNLGTGRTVGEHFFDLSGATFESTAFIQSIVPKGGADEIVKHLSAAGNADDGASPELVKKRLAAAKDSQFTKRHVGAGDKLADRIDRLKSDLIAEKERARILENLKATIRENEDEIERQSQRKQQLAAIANMASNLRRRDQLKEFIEICKIKNELKAQCRGIDKEFINSCNKKLWDCEKLESNAKNAAVNADIAMAKAGVESREQADLLLKKIQNDLHRLDVTVAAPKKHSRYGLLTVGLIIIVLSIAFGILLSPYAFPLSAVGLIIAALSLINNKKSAQHNINSQQDKANLQLVLQKAQTALTSMDLRDAAQKEYDDVAENFLCDIKKLDENATVSTAKQTLDRFDKLLTALQDKTSSFSALSQALDVSYQQAVTELSAMPESEVTEEQILYAKTELSTIDHTLTELIKSIAALNEKLNSSGPHRGAAEIEREIADMEKKLSARKLFADAADLANEILADAYSELRQSFGPQLNQKTAELFCKLTGGKYNQVKVAHGLTLTAGEQGSFNLIDTDYLSAGTADQAYIALRLAFASLIAGGSLPVLLDDAFLQFDAKREAEAFALLSELSGSQQFIFFTCRGETAELAKQVNANIINI